jgi:hypothetical protein
MESRNELSSMSYERVEDVDVYRIEDFETLFDEEIDRAEEFYRDRSSDERVTATVVRFDGAPQLGSDAQDHINQVWSQLAQLVDIERAAYVGDGISAMAVESNVEAPGVAIESFTDRQEAIEWAKGSA